jgi:hypothetical protein
VHREPSAASSDIVCLTKSIKFLPGAAAGALATAATNAARRGGKDR